MNREIKVEYIDKEGVSWVNENVRIEYNFEIERRSWGIKEITFSLRKIGIGREYYENFDEEEDREIEKEIDISDYEIIEEWRAGYHYAIGEQCGIEIDEKKKEITVYLYYLSKGNDF